MKTNKTQQTITAYNRNAQAYEEKFANYAPYREKISRFQAACLSKNDAILDIGCGPGNNAGLLLEKDQSYRITGVDLSGEMISLARDRYPGCDFHVGDMRIIEIREVYDAVIASFCIAHLTAGETMNLLRKISAALKDGGRLYLSFMEGSGAGMETTSFSKDEIYFNYYSVEAVREMLDAVSIKFTDISFEPYREPDGSLTRDVFIFAVKRL